MSKFSVSERFACRVLGQHRSTQRKKPHGRPDEEALTADIIRLASRYGRYGYRRITAMLRSEGWMVNAKRVERIWRREGLKVPQKQPKKGRLWLNDGSCVRLRPEYPNHVWSYDFVEGRTHNGRKFRMLNIIDEFTRECLAIRVARRINSFGVSAVGPVDHGFVKSVYMYDPNGIQMELTYRVPEHDRILGEATAAFPAKLAEWTKRTRAQKEAKFGAEAIDRRSRHVS